MIVPDDIGIKAFLGDAQFKETVLEHLREFESHGDAALKTAMLQEKWNDQAQHGVAVNPYPKIVRREDIAGLRISGDWSTLYALGKIRQSQFFLLEGDPESRIYGVNFFYEDAFHKGLGVPASLVCILKVISEGLPPEQQIPWLRQFWTAIPVGASLWQAPMTLILWALSDPNHGILGLSDAVTLSGAGERGLQAVQDFLALYQSWQAGGRAVPPEWFSFYTQAESIPKSGGNDGSTLPAAACAARAAAVEASIESPLPVGTLAIQISGDNLRAAGTAIQQAGLYASYRSIAPGVWYAACAGVLLDILANCPVPEQPSK